LARIPCFNALNLTLCFPEADLGPVDFCALRRLISARLGAVWEVAVWMVAVIAVMSFSGWELGTTSVAGEFISVESRGVAVLGYLGPAIHLT
jgi:hypothetical protein